MSPTEHDLLARYVRSRDPEAFSRIVERHQNMVFAVCLRILGNAADAEDAAQSAFLQLVRKAGEVHGSVAGWLHRVAVGVSINALRRNKARRFREARVAARGSGRADKISWEEARDAAAASAYQVTPGVFLQGHLATVTSEAENAWLVANLYQVLGYLHAAWLGAYQDTGAPDYSEPDGGWTWITGEEWSYTNWYSGEPNDHLDPGSSENYLVAWLEAGGKLGTSGVFLSSEEIHGQKFYQSFSKNHLDNVTLQCKVLDALCCEVPWWPGRCEEQTREKAQKTDT